MPLAGFAVVGIAREAPSKTELGAALLSEIPTGAVALISRQISVLTALYLVNLGVIALMAGWQAGPSVISAGFGSLDP